MNHRKDVYKKMIAGIVGDDINKKILERKCYDKRFKGQFEASAFSVILEQALGVVIPEGHVLVENDQCLMAEVGNLLGEDRDESGWSYSLQVTTLAMPYPKRHGEIIPMPAWMPDDEVYSLPYTGGTLQVGGLYNDSVAGVNKSSSTWLQALLKAQLSKQSGYMAGPNERSVDDLMKPKFCKKNNFGDFFIRWAMLPASSYEAEAQELGLSKDDFDKAVQELPAFLDPTREMAIISILCLSHISAVVGKPSLCVTDEYAEWLCSYQNKNLNDVFLELKSKDEFKDLFYKHYEKVLGKLGKKARSKADVDQWLSDFDFWDVKYVRRAEFHKKIDEAARNRMRTSMP